jgi:sarcosine oxidase delta subunit
MFDKSCNVITNLQADKFFGLFQIMLDLYSGYMYRTENIKNKGDDSENHSKECTTLMKIEKNVFLQILMSDEGGSTFEHFHKMAITRYIHFKRIRDSISSNIKHMTGWHAISSAFSKSTQRK